ncbi:VPS35 endosomal protein sorting factor-like isoform X2 [Ipomoea triloba]|uniref:VPS35 endosomal protein sorting factor-like isoform X2 n=1 Tax=Ipomoea triloba TaxID=35885 RepID=UPI00125E0C22|nr:VPS35 endosomal protein sorting factor-like isoform X2 [Ipomoea triloba]
MELNFRDRDYRGEAEAHALPSVPAAIHPLSTPSPPHHQGDVADYGKDDFFDPLRRHDVKADASSKDLPDEVKSLKSLSEVSPHLSEKEWTSFRNFLMKRFPISRMISISSMSGSIMKSAKGNEKQSTNVHLEELEDPDTFAEEEIKVISHREYVSHLYELKDEINHAWKADNRVASLKLSIKVARLLMDTSGTQFYPTLFVLATDVIDTLGHLVWERIIQKAKYGEDGKVIHSLPDNFQASDICTDAKETCYNWFCKIASVRELLPRIYLELALLPCWRFLLDKPMDCIHRLVMMIRGISDPLASFYCRLYLVHCAQKLPDHSIGYLVNCINDMKTLFMDIASVEKSKYQSLSEKKMLVGLVEPAVEYIMKCLFKDCNPLQVGDILVGLGLGRSQSKLFGNSSCSSIILHHLLKELPVGIICLNALDILHLIEYSNDYSFDQSLNYKLLGLRLCENTSQVSEVDIVIKKVIQVVSRYDSLDEYIKVVDAFAEIILQKQMDSYLNVILDGIFDRASSEEIRDIELTSLQSILMKLLNHFGNIDNILNMNHFIDILDVMYGSSRNTVNMKILSIATGENASIRDPTTIQFLFEVSRALHDEINLLSKRDDENREAACLISRFVNMVDYGPDVEHHLEFLLESRGAFGCMNEVKETLVHSCNHLAIKSMRNDNRHPSFVKSCVAYCEVTLPSISSCLKQLNLYLETAEVALMAGLVLHSEGLIDSVFTCLHNVDQLEELQILSYADRVTNLLCKLCSLLVMLPGNPDQGVTSIHKNILSFLNSQSGLTLGMKIKVLCGLIRSSAALSQNTPPYHELHKKMNNVCLFYGDPTYKEELLQVSAVILQSINNIVLLESNQLLLHLQKTNEYVLLWIFSSRLLVDILHLMPAIVLHQHSVCVMKYQKCVSNS